MRWRQRRAGPSWELSSKYFQILAIMWVSVSPVVVGEDQPALVTGVKLVRQPSSSPQPIPAKTPHQLYPRVPGRTCRTQTRYLYSNNFQMSVVMFSKGLQKFSISRDHIYTHYTILYNIYMYHLLYFNISPTRLYLLAYHIWSIHLILHIVCSRNYFWHQIKSQIEGTFWMILLLTMF